MIETLEWDSNFFKQKIGKVQIQKFEENQAEEIKQEIKLHGFDLVYLFVNEIEAAEIEALEAIGANLVDRKVTYYKKLSKTSENTPQFETFEGQVTPKLLELALASGHKSRFFMDPRTRPYFPELYRLWIQNSVNKEVADEVLVSKHHDEISGFVTLKKDGNNGSIGLIAVDEKIRGMGIGKALLTAAESWYISNHCEEATVVTQKDNEQACVFYEKAGYSINNIQFVFHL
jgi:dTDP-4-amino-4,6-dideoxy-D-galactose acyltransferase